MKFREKGQLLYGSNKCTCNYDSDIFTTVNSTHLTVGASKVTKIHKMSYSCFNNALANVKINIKLH